MAAEEKITSTPRSSSERKILGIRGEDLAADFFIRHGFEVIARNWRCPEGELDVVVRNGDDVRVVEVKTRRGTYHNSGPEEVVDDAKLDRLWEAIAWFLEKHPELPQDIHLDVMTVTFTSADTPVFGWLKDFE